jgi:hypothetical protein
MIHPSVDHTQLVSPEGFDREFFKLIGSRLIPTQEHAFELLNEAYREQYGRYRYASFDSYRVSRNRRIRSLKK